MAKKKMPQAKNKNITLSTRQRNLAKAGAFLTLAAGSFAVGNLNQHENVNAEPTVSGALAKEAQARGRLINHKEVSADELLSLLSNGDSSSVKTNGGYSAHLLKELPSGQELADKYAGGDFVVSEVKTSYDIRKLLAIKDADVYYSAHSLSQTQPQLIKMSEYRQLIQENPNIQVTSTGEFTIVSSHLYSTPEEARMDAANWKDSRVIESKRAKEVRFAGKSSNAITNFRADDGTLMNGVRIDRDLSLDVKAKDGSAKLTESMKNDFIDSLEKNFTVAFNGKTYQAVYHDEATTTNHGRDHIDGYFTFSDSTHGLPLQINGQFIVDAVNFGDSVSSLEDALSLHAVKSYEDTNSWIDTNEPTTSIALNFVDGLKDDAMTYYQIEAKEQVIHSLAYDYMTVEKAQPETNVVYAGEISPIEIDEYDSSNTLNITPKIDNAPDAEQAPLGSDQQNLDYYGNTISWNGTISISQNYLNVTPEQFPMWLDQADFTVNGVTFNTFVPQGINLKGDPQNYIGYLSGPNGEQGKDMIILVTNTQFSAYDLTNVFRVIHTSNNPFSPGTTPPQTPEFKIADFHVADETIHYSFVDGSDVAGTPDDHGDIVVDLTSDITAKTVICVTDAKGDNPVYYFTNGKVDVDNLSFTFDETGQPVDDQGHDWYQGLPVFKEIENPEIPGYEVVSSVQDDMTRSEDVGQLEDIPEQSITDGNRDTHLHFVVTYAPKIQTPDITNPPVTTKPMPPDISLPPVQPIEPNIPNNPEVNTPTVPAAPVPENPSPETPEVPTSPVPDSPQPETPGHPILPVPQAPTPHGPTVEPTTPEEPKPNTPLVPVIPVPETPRPITPVRPIQPSNPLLPTRPIIIPPTHKLLPVRPVTPPTSNQPNGETSNNPNTPKVINTSTGDHQTTSGQNNKQLKNLPMTGDKYDKNLSLFGSGLFGLGLAGLALKKKKEDDDNHPKF